MKVQTFFYRSCFLFFSGTLGAIWAKMMLEVCFFWVIFFGSFFGQGKFGLKSFAPPKILPAPTPVTYLCHRSAQRSKHNRTLTLPRFHL